TNIINTSKYKMYNTKYIESLKLNLKTTKRLCNQLKAKLRRRQVQLRKRQANFDKVFNIDQRQCIARSSYRGILWSARTVNKALKLYVACGQKGYEEIRRQNLPYPNIRTLQECIQYLKFKPDVLEDVFTILKIKVKTFKPEEKHAVLLIDEMAIKPGLQYDNSTTSIIGRPTNCWVDVPDAREFKQTLRLVCLSQFQANINRSNYSITDSEHLIDYCKDIKKLDLINAKQCLESNDNDLWNAQIYKSLIGNEMDLNNITQTALTI
ncbi:hypothetical protein ALC57_04432, partial [Trachymyrmex cornetzi]